jgi:hypothetical protein
MPNEQGAFKEALQIINDCKADIINVGITAQQANKRIYFFRLAACDTDVIKKALEAKGFEVLHAMD